MMWQINFSLFLSHIGFEAVVCHHKWHLAGKNIQQQSLNTFLGPYQGRSNFRKV